MLFLCGNVETLNNSIFTAIDDVVKISLTLLGTMCFWSGIMQIASKTKIMNGLKKMLKPILRILFPDEQNDDKVQEEISMNMIANIMGLGNAATPLGLKAMQSLQKKNKDKKRLSNSMAMLIVINTASIQIIPTTVMAVRHSLGSENTSKIILPIWIATIVVAIFVVAISKTLMKKY
ncbi:MAG: nucleoside recognition domain-containing protein [Clostridia bacterium]